MSVVTSVKPVSHLPTKQLMKHRNGPIYRLFRDLFMQTSTFSNLQQPAGMALPFNVLTVCRVVHLAFYTPRIFLFWEPLQTALCVFCFLVLDHRMCTVCAAGTVNITYSAEHQGHRCEVGHQQLIWDTRASIATLRTMGVPYDDVLDRHQLSHCNSPVSRVCFPVQTWLEQMI